MYLHILYLEICRRPVFTAVYPFFHPYRTVLDFEKTYTVRLMGEIDLLIRPRSSYTRKLEIPHSLQSTRQRAPKCSIQDE